jgi:hypothetical protein
VPALSSIFDGQKGFMRKHKLLSAALAALGIAFVPSISRAQSLSTQVAQETLFLNEANTVSGGTFLESGGDTGMIGGRYEGNGQNWLTLVVNWPNPSNHSINTVDLRGVALHWAYNKKDGSGTLTSSFGEGTITFTDDTKWASVPVGTMIGINEWNKVCYDASGNRNGGYDGFNVLHDTASGAATLNLNTGTYLTSDTWHFYAGDNGTSSGATPSGTGVSSMATAKYFTFVGFQAKSKDGNPHNSVTQVGSFNVSYVGDTSGGSLSYNGSNSAGLFVANNDNWQATVLDNVGSIISNSVGEKAPNYGGSGVNSQEVFKLEKIATSASSGTFDYSTITNHNYDGGHESTYLLPNVWNSTSAMTQDLSSTGHF